MTEQQLAEIEEKAEAVTHYRLSVHQCGLVARNMCLEHVPALVAEVRRLRSELRYLQACQF